MALATQLDKINNFNPDLFFPLHLVSPEGGKPITVGCIEKEIIAPLLIKEGHLSVKKGVAEVVYHKGEKTVEAKLASIMKCLIKNGLIDKNDPHLNEMLDIVPNDGVHIDPNKSVGQCPRALMRFMGFVFKAALTQLADAQNNKPVIWLGNTIPDDITRLHKKGIYDPASGTVTAGQSFEQAAIEETWQEAGVDMKAVPYYQPLGQVHMSRNSKDDREDSKYFGKVVGSKHEVIAIYSFDMAKAKKDGKLPHSFQPQAQEVPAKTWSWSPHSIESLPMLFRQPFTLVRHKACASALALHLTNLWSAAGIEEMAIRMTTGMNGSIFHKLHKEGGTIQIKALDETGPAILNARVLRARYAELAV